MNKKKYIIKESELKDIIKEMIIMEAYNPDDFKGNYTSEKGRQAAANINTGNLVKNAGAILTGIPNALIPDEWKERVQSGDNAFIKWLLGALGATTGGAVGADYLPNVSNLKIFGGPGVGKGNNHDAHEVFNPANAIAWLKNYSYPHYIKGRCGNCAKYVKLAMNNGGLSAPWGMNASDAKNYLRILPSNGWVEISAREAGQPGDVVVLDAFVTPEGKSHPSGHIAMCGYNGLWMSDFKQKDALGINGSVPADKIHYYRYTNMA